MSQERASSLPQPVARPRILAIDTSRRNKIIMGQKNPSIALSKMTTFSSLSVSIAETTIELGDRLGTENINRAIVQGHPPQYWRFFGRKYKLVAHKLLFIVYDSLQIISR